ncbi:hypothetical protein GYMLUDRAFT_962768 [Collybiopsis luxurians FD-317 M1]|uniref:Unplaced genomic scaffold GYMLUscaffold_90, whole genome shotgun sequence n=1 Tax=Collybiopsis luxurians FD-317 M1 TaxID=944289 RepID=A0A0D0C4F8_9AGAR|nr:hypothetical protein GYMLUDRAFT_962768 [Collybiopsis luxurians FD-317 M1]
MALLLDRDMAGYESELAHLHSQILYVEAQKKRLFNYKRKIYSLLSSIRRLPNEILGRVFELACGMNLLQEHPWTNADNPPATKLSSPSLTYLPSLVISSVCALFTCTVIRDSTGNTR